MGCICVCVYVCVRACVHKCMCVLYVLVWVVRVCVLDVHFYLSPLCSTSIASSLNLSSACTCTCTPTHIISQEIEAIANAKPYWSNPCKIPHASAFVSLKDTPSRWTHRLKGKPEAFDDNLRVHAVLNKTFDILQQLTRQQDHSCGSITHLKQVQHMQRYTRLRTQMWREDGWGHGRTFAHISISLKIYIHTSPVIPSHPGSWQYPPMFWQQGGQYPTSW